MSLRYNFIKRLFVICALVIVIVLLWDYLKTIDLLQRYFVNRVESMIAYFTIGESADADTSTSARMSYIPVALNAFFDSPIWGMGGLGYSPQYFMKVIHVTHPHNNYLNLLASGGLFLFFVFYWFPFKLLVNTYSLLRENIKKREIVLLFSLILSLLFNDLSASIYNIPVILIAYAVIYKYYLIFTLRKK
jgi:O-antigen ligase